MYVTIRRSRAAVPGGRTAKHGNKRIDEAGESSQQTVTRRCFRDSVDDSGVNSAEVVEMISAGPQDHRRLAIRRADTESKMLVEWKSRNVHESSSHNEFARPTPTVHPSSLSDMLKQHCYFPDVHGQRRIRHGWRIPAGVPCFAAARYRTGMPYIRLLTRARMK